MKSRVVLLGPPASGKGTQAELIEDSLGIPAISPGQVLREEAASGSDIGRRAAEFTSQGRLAPDDLVVELIRTWMGRNDGKFVFDGFPRSTGQAQALEAMLSGRGTPLDVVVLFEVSETIIKERVLHRRVCGTCRRIYSVGLNVSETDACPRCGGELIRRGDDTLETLVARMAEYAEMTFPLVAFYDERRLLCRIDSSRTPDEVFQSLKKALT